MYKNKLLIWWIIILTLFACYNNKIDKKNIYEDFYQNPILPSGNNPQAIYYGGKYYYTHETNDMILLWETEDITDMSNALCKEVWKPKNKDGKYNIWAPEIHRINGKWYIYYAADDGNTDNHQIFVIENDSDSPMTGEFKQKGPIITNKEWNWGIHTTTFIYNDTQYLVWSGWPKRRMIEETQCIYIASMKNPWTLGSDRVMISEPEYCWERQWINPDGTRTAYPIYVNEAPSFFKSKNNDKIIIYYSASGCWTPYYCVGMLYCRADNDILNPKSWIKSSEPVFTMSAKDSIWGPGSPSFFPSPDGNEWYMLYHARIVPNGIVGSGELRSPRIQKIEWDNEGMPILGKPVKLNVFLKKPSKLKK